MLIYPSTAAVFEQAAAKSRRNYQYEKINTSKAHDSYLQSILKRSVVYFLYDFFMKT